MAVFKKRGKWWIGFKTAGGKRRREPVGPSYELAKQVLAKRLNEVLVGRHFPERAANVMPFETLVDKYTELHAKNLRSDSWRPMLDRAKERFAGRKVGQIKPEDVQRYYNDIAARASYSTANRHRTLLCSVFNRARDWGYFYGENPCRAVKKHREPAHRLRYLPKDEIDRLMVAAHPRFYPLLVCALMTGMRRGEIFGLDWKNVDLNTGTIYILESKSGRPREVPIATQLRTVLENLGPRREGLVFDLPYISLRRYLDKALAAANIANFRFHDLRHTFASHFIMRTNDLPTLQRILGHSTPAMTLRYAHLSRGHLVAEMALFEAGVPLPKPPDCGRGSSGPPIPEPLQPPNLDAIMRPAEQEVAHV